MLPAMRPNTVDSGNPILNSPTIPLMIFSPVPVTLVVISETAMRLNSLYLLNRMVYMRYCPLKNTSSGINKIIKSNFDVSLKAIIKHDTMVTIVVTIMHSILQSFVIAATSFMSFEIIIAWS